MNPSTDNSQNILIVAPHGIGDLLMTVPVVMQIADAGYHVFVGLCHSCGTDCQCDDP